LSKEQLFDFLCNHFGEDYETVESLIFRYLYGYLIENNIKSFLQHLKTLKNIWELGYQKATTVNEKITYLYYIHSILKVMNFINEQLGEELYKW